MAIASAPWPPTLVVLMSHGHATPPAAIRAYGAIAAETDRRLAPSPFAPGASHMRKVAPGMAGSHAASATAQMRPAPVWGSCLAWQAL